MKLIVYTALFATDDIESPGKFFEGYKHDKGDVEYIAFTNRRDIKSDFWDVRYVDLLPTDPIGRKTARYHKLNPHKVLPEHDYSIWCDSAVYMKTTAKWAIDHVLKDNDVAIHRHAIPSINSVFVEGMVTMYMYNTADPSVTNPQLEKYHSEGMPFHYDHFETGALLRKNSELANQFNDLWWSEVDNGSVRDQISCPYAVWKLRTTTDIKIATLRETHVSHNQTDLPKSKVFSTIPKPVIPARFNKKG